VLDHFLSSSEAYKRIIVIVGFEVFLGISFSMVKDIEHFVFLVLKIVGIPLELPLHLELLALEGRIDYIG
jgi:hypothetical protein